MDYQLAKKLKDEGYPQNHTDFSGRFSAVNENTGELGEEVYYPTLKEMIDDIGECFWTLRKHTKGWEASSAEDDVVKVEGGQDCKEAVAKLWIAVKGR